MPPLPLTRRSIFAQAWPIMLGQTTVPLVGLVDTFVIGRTGDAAALAGVAIGATIINFVFWSFGFLRMGMTGLAAQATGAADAAEVDALLVRGVGIGLAVGTCLYAAQIALIPLAFAILSGSAEIDAPARAFVAARFVGAPAGLAVFAINGWLLGLGRTRAALMLSIAMNLINAGLDVLLVWHFDLGARGVGLGTAAAEWSALGIGLWLVRGHVRALGNRARLFNGAALRRLFVVNANIMIRTVALLTTFTWFTNAGARLGAEALAANQVLMQAVALSAFVLDGFCFTAESRVGHAIGAGDPAQLRRATRLTLEFCVIVALAFGAGIVLFGAPAVQLLTANAAVQAQAIALLPLVAILPLAGTPAWLLDGVFIGATEGRSLRNAAIVATALYIAADVTLRPLGARGVWLGLLASYLLRAAALGHYWPQLMARVARVGPRP